MECLRQVLQRTSPESIHNRTNEYQKRFDTLSNFVIQCNEFQERCQQYLDVGGGKDPIAGMTKLETDLQQKNQKWNIMLQDFVDIMTSLFADVRILTPIRHLKTVDFSDLAKTYVDAGVVGAVGPVAFQAAGMDVAEDVWQVCLALQTTLLRLETVRARLQPELERAAEAIRAAHADLTLCR
eukprot:Rmarinus@m.5080